MHAAQVSREVQGVVRQGSTAEQRLSSALMPTLLSVQHSQAAGTRPVRRGAALAGHQVRSISASLSFPRREDPWIWTKADTLDG
jgi:hypothetical protein